MCKTMLFRFLFCFIPFSHFCSADTEFEGPISLDVVAALFNSYGETDFAIYSDIVDSFPDFPLPTGFSTIGSVIQMSSVRVVFETDLEEEVAIQSISEELESSGWIPFPIFRPPVARGGFISPQEWNITRADVLCHDELGNLTIRYFSQGNSNYLSATVPRIISRQQGSCEQQIAMQQASMGQMARSAGLHQYLPRMEIPETQNIPRPTAFISGGTSSSGNSIETDGRMTSDEGIEAIYEFFADQIEAQEWELDSESIGSRSANGTWVRSPESDLNLVGTLSVVDVGDDEFELRFRLTAEGFTSNSIFTPFRN